MWQTSTGRSRRAAAAVAVVLGVGAIAWALTAWAVPGRTFLASTSDTGVKSNNVSGGASLSADGTKVAFTSAATNLDPGDPLFVSAVDLDPADTDSSLDVYVKDLADGNLELASSSASGVDGNGSSESASLSADGTRVALASRATTPDPSDAGSGRDIYLKDLISGQIVVVSASDSGVVGNGGSFLPPVSATGTIVAFESRATNLHPRDRDSGPDILGKRIVAPALS